MRQHTQRGLIYGIPGYGAGSGGDGYSYLTGEQAARVALSFEDTDSHPLLQALMLDSSPIRADGITLKDYSTSGTDRPVQPGRYYVGDGVNDEMRWTTANIGMLYVSYYNITDDLWVDTSITHGGTYYAFSVPAKKISNIKLWTDNAASAAEKQANTFAVIPSNLWSWQRCEDNSDSVAYDCSGSGHHASFSGIVAATFLAEGGDAPYSAANELGYSDGGGGVIVPRDESDPTKDVLGNALDYTGRVPYDGLLLGSPCVTLDGVNDYATLNDRVTTGSPSALSAACWINTTDTAGGIIGEYEATSGRSWVMEVRTSGELRVTLSGDGTTTHKQYSTAEVVGDGEWHHIAFTFGSGTLTIYVDGVDVTSTVIKSVDSAVTALYDTSNNFIAGAYGTGSQFLAGAITDVRVWQSTLSGADIASVMAWQSVGTPVGWWPISDQYSDYLANKVDPDKPLQLKNHTLASVWANTQDEFHESVSNGCDVVPWFNGASSKITVATAQWSDVSGGFTFSCKLRLDSYSASNSGIITSATSGNNSFYVTQLGSLQLRLGGGTLGVNKAQSANGAIELGKWHDINVTWDGTDIVATVDGVEVINSGLSGPSFLSELVAIGVYASASSPLTGAIAEISMSGAFAYDCDQGTNTFTDSSGNGNNGTGNNLTWLAIPTQTDGSSTVGRTAPTSDGTGSIPLGVQVEVLRSGGVDSPVAYQQGWDTVTADFAPGDGQETTPNYHAGESDGPFEQFFSFGA